MFGYITGTNLFPEPLTPEEEKIAIDRLASGDEEARNLLIERNLRLVVHVCKKYANTNIDQDDLLSIGTIGLIKGVNSFKPEKGSKLSTYVSKCVDNEVHLNEPIGKDKDDNVITLEEVLENDDKCLDDVVDTKMKIRKMYNKIKEVLKDREKTIIELRFGLKGGKPKTQKEIAKMMGISRSYVSRIETKAIEKLADGFRE